MSLKNSFSAAITNRYTRDFGGTLVGVADPYLTGYHFIWFDALPSKLIDMVQRNTDVIDGARDIQNILSGACYGVTPPGGTLNKVEIVGLGGIKFAVAGNIDYGNSVSVKFLEFQGTPILHIFHSWIQMMRDYRTGVDSFDGVGATAMKTQYSSLLYYWTTLPDGVTINYYACYDGVFPTKDPQDLYASDVETVGRLDVEIEFNVDYIWREQWVKTDCEIFLQALTPDLVAQYRSQGIRKS